VPIGVYQLKGFVNPYSLGKQVNSIISAKRENSTLLNPILKTRFFVFVYTKALNLHSALSYILLVMSFFLALLV
jgi:hypothetical protein